MHVWSRIFGDELMVGTTRRKGESLSETHEDISRIDVEVTRHFVHWVMQRGIPQAKVMDIVYGDHDVVPGKYAGTKVYTLRNSEDDTEVIASDRDCSSGGKKRRLITAHLRE